MKSSGSGSSSTRNHSRIRIRWRMKVNPISGTEGSEMPTIRVKNNNVAANSTTYPLAGNQYEQLPFDARVEFGITASAETIDVTVYSGSDVLQQAGPPTVKATSPIYPDDFLLDDMAVRGEKISVVLRETGGVATTDIETVVKITPM